MINFKKNGGSLTKFKFDCVWLRYEKSKHKLNCKKEIKTITLEDFSKNINNSEYQYIDTRNDEAYNGFKVDDIKNGGHLKNSIQYSASFIGKVNKDKEDKFISDKGLDKKKKNNCLRH